MCTLQEIELLKTLNKQGNLFLNIQNRYNALVRPELSLIEETSSPRLGSLVETLVNMGNSQDLGGGGNTNTPTGNIGGGGNTDTPTGNIVGGGNTDTPTGNIGGGGNTDTPTGNIGGGGNTDTPTGNIGGGGNTDTPTGNIGGCASTQYGCCPGTSTPSNATRSNCIGGGGSRPPRGRGGGHGGRRGGGGGEAIADPKLRALNSKFNSLLQQYNEVTESQLLRAKTGKNIKKQVRQAERLNKKLLGLLEQMDKMVLGKLQDTSKPNRENLRTRSNLNRANVHTTGQTVDKVSQVRLGLAQDLNSLIGEDNDRKLRVKAEYYRYITWTLVTITLVAYTLHYIRSK